MNSRQRRGVILLLLSILCAFGAFVGVLSVISDANSKVGPEAVAYELKENVAPYTALRSDQFVKVKIPQRWLPETAVKNISDVDGHIAVTGLEKGSLLQRDMITEQPALKAGEQEIAIMIDAATGVAGKIRPGNSVNIFATFDGEGEQKPAVSKIIVSDARVIDVGSLTALEPGKGDDRRRASEAVPITFALNTLDAQRVAYAESFAQHVRLALVAPGSDTTIGRKDRTYELETDR